MASSLITDLLKTPSQIRKENDQRLLTEGLAQAQLATQGNTLGGVGGMFANFGAQQAAQTGRNITNAFRGVTDAAGTLTGADLRPVDERQAGVQQKLMSGIQMGNLQSMKAKRQQLVEAGVNPIVIQQLDAAIVQAAERNQQKLRQGKADTRADEQLQLAKDKAERESVAQDMLDDVRATVGNLDLNKAEDRSTAATALIGIGKTADAVAILKMNETTGSIGTDTTKNIEYFAKLLNCDIKNPECARNAVQAAQEYKRGGASENILELRFEKLEEGRDNAGKSRNSMGIIRESLKTLEQGNVNIGTFGKGRQFIERLLQETMGLDRDGSVSRTTAILTNLQRLSGELLASGIFGAGTGLSDADRQRAEQLFNAGGTLTAEETKEILDLHMRYERAKIIRHNERVMDEAQFTERFYQDIGVSRQAMLAEVPTPYIGSEADGWKSYNEGQFYKNPYTNEYYDTTTGDLVERKPNSLTEDKK